VQCTGVSSTTCDDIPFDPSQWCELPSRLASREVWSAERAKLLPPTFDTLYPRAPAEKVLSYYLDRNSPRAFSSLDLITAQRLDRVPSRRGLRTHTLSGRDRRRSGSALVEAKRSRQAGKSSGIAGLSARPGDLSHLRSGSDAVRELGRLPEVGWAAIQRPRRDCGLRGWWVALILHGSDGTATEKRRTNPFLFWTQSYIEQWVRFAIEANTKAKQTRLGRSWHRFRLNRREPTAPGRNQPTLPRAAWKTVKRGR
jgi:hypothetical protein